MKRRIVAFFMVFAVLGTMFYGCKRKEPEEKVSSLFISECMLFLTNLEMIFFTPKSKWLTL